MTSFWCPHGHKTDAVVEDYVSTLECSCCGLPAKTHKPQAVDFDNSLDSTLDTFAASGTVFMGGSSAIPSWMHS